MSNKRQGATGSDGDRPNSSCVVKLQRGRLSKSYSRSGCVVVVLMFCACAIQGREQNSSSCSSIPSATLVVLFFGGGCRFIGCRGLNSHCLLLLLLLRVSSSLLGSSASVTVPNNNPLVIVIVIFVYRLLDHLFPINRILTTVASSRRHTKRRPARCRRKIIGRYKIRQKNVMYTYWCL